ncbi:unnamed protein product [[Candida] boidinii]|uniref:Endoribonuclease YSH1 n=1 Tax=Candida boidinii TaxID=5477 RepID=A0A9W6T322_CANBO|nr:hypothetical protein B5S30_g1892 [[Candida] boidinii]OWB84410.1 hypothetical protein B5S33_g3055 [[Candida] boidinii]GME75603.1 unnamed protein product [[Candida] boidinii]GMG04086.1 unnamed protein product [[Candida] boidinii]
MIQVENNDGEELKFFCLGGGNEVGRSCHIIEYKGKTIMLDAGVHPAYSGLESLPFYDEYDLSRVDILLISHFHLDHAASLPYVMQHTTFKGRVFMTYPTKAIYKWLLNDFVRVTTISDDNDSSNQTASSLYTDADLNESLDRIETIDYHSTIEVDGIRFTAYHAGHVLGAAMFFIEIGGIKVLFTGDYSREEDRHLSAAELPPSRPDLLITESTFGTATHIPRLERETKLTRLIHGTLAQGGRCLLPVFALGRAQEILLILDEYWQENPDLENVPIYYASDLAKKCIAVYQRYVNMMNDSIRKKFTETNHNPFHFKYIKNITSMERLDDLNPCVILASPGMLQNGISRRVLEKWAPDPRNTVLMTGYSIEGTMAKILLTEPTEIPSMVNPDIMVPRRINIDEISFAAHVDYEQNSKFIELVNPKTIILVHGESNPMGRLKSALLSKYQKLRNTDNEVKVYNPKNGSVLSLTFKGIKIAKVMGSLAIELPSDKQILNGVLVQKNFDLNLLKIDDLREFSNLTSTVLRERQSVRCYATNGLIHWSLSQMFGYVKIITDEPDEYVLEVMDSITITMGGGNYIVTVEWISGLVNDTIADSVIAIILSVDSSPASVKLSSKSCSHDHSNSGENSSSTATTATPDITQIKSLPVPKEIGNGKDNFTAGSQNGNELGQVSRKQLYAHADYSKETRLNRIKKLLKTQFGKSFEDHFDESYALIKIGKHEAKIDYDLQFKVTCASGALRGRIENVLSIAVDLVSPLALE